MRNHVLSTCTVMVMLFNLVAGDAIKKCKVAKNALDVAFEVSKLVKFSPKRSA